MMRWDVLRIASAQSYGNGEMKMPRDFFVFTVDSSFQQPEPEQSVRSVGQTATHQNIGKYSHQ